jgi:hypothetical protein
MIVFLIGFEPTNDEAKIDKMNFLYYIIFFEIVFFLILFISMVQPFYNLNFQDFSFYVSTPVYKISYIDGFYYSSSFLFNFGFYIFEYMPLAFYWCVLFY